MEIWKDINGYEGLYQVSNEGRVKSLNYNHTKREGILKPQKLKNDYLKVTLYKDTYKNQKLLHMLVAEAFIPNPLNKPTVNHINHNRQDNRVENLEWATYPEQMDETTRENISHSQINHPKKSFVVYQYTLDGELVNVYPSTMECDREGFNASDIQKCCVGGYFSKTRNKWINITQYKGYKWSYEPL